MWENCSFEIGEYIIYYQNNRYIFIFYTHSDTLSHKHRLGHAPLYLWEDVSECVQKMSVYLLLKYHTNK